MYFVQLAGSGHVTASRQTSEVHQLHRYLYHHLPPLSPSPLPMIFHILPDNFNTMDKKVFYALLLMKEGVAHTWKEQYL